MRFAAALALSALALSSCDRARTRVHKPDDTIQFGHFKRVAVLPFADEKGEGRQLAEELGGQLKRLGHVIVDVDDVAKIVGKSKKDDEVSVGLETLELLRSRTNADVLVLGTMAPDWSSASVVAIETELGDQVIRAHVRPRDASQAVFTKRGDCAAQIAAALVRR